MKSYLKKGSVAIVDQVLFSGSNFLVNIFLVKLLSPNDYGLFGSLYSLYLLLFIAFAAIFLEPYMFYKNKLKDTENYTKIYAGFSNSILVISLMFTLLGLFLSQTILVYMSYIIITCIIYFYKRHFFSILLPIKSLGISVLYFISMVSGLVFLNFYVEKNLFNAFLVLNVASFICIIPTILFRDEFRTLLIRKVDFLYFGSIMKKQKKYSFHCLSSSVLSWIPNNIYFILIPIFFSNEINAQFKAIQNISLPIYHLNIAIVSMLVPMFIKAINPLNVIKKVSILFMCIPLSYLICVLYFLPQIEHYIYSDKYYLSSYLVILLIGGLTLEILSNIFKAYFRSIEKPEIVTRINFFNVITSLLFIYFVYNFALKGVIISYLLNNIFNLANSIYSFNEEKKMRIKEGSLLVDIHS